MFFSPQEIAALIQEDQPFLDLTTRMLGIGDKAADMRFRCRQDISVAGTELAVKILDACGLMVTESQPSGALVATGTTLLAAEGSASAAHSAWKVAQNVLEYACGIATYSAQLVQQARQINPRISVVATRKNIPGIRRFAVMAALAGGSCRTGWAFQKVFWYSTSTWPFRWFIAFCNNWRNTGDGSPPARSWWKCKRRITP